MSQSRYLALFCVIVALAACETRSPLDVAQQHTPPKPQMTVASDCLAGMYFDGTDCVPAPVGTYVPVAGATSYTQCAVGTYQSALGQMMCYPAPPGYYVDHVGASDATPCPAGKYNPSTQQSECAPADPGHYVATVGATSETACTVGYFQPFPQSIGCSIAARGFYVDHPAATSETACPTGMTTNYFGSTSINDCVPKPIPVCAVGWYYNGASCVPAPIGTYVPSTGATTYIVCSAGTYQPNTGMFVCQPAAKGYYVDHDSATAELPCNAGYYQPNIQRTSCIAASAGAYVDVTAAQSQTPCAVGYYQPNTAQISCIPADLGSYVPNQGATAELACPAGTTTAQIASTSLSDCLPFTNVLNVFVTQAVTTNTLVGVGAGGSGAPLLAQWQQTLQGAQANAAAGRTPAACAQLGYAFVRADGSPKPPDTVTGPAAPRLAAFITTTMSTLACR